MAPDGRAGEARSSSSRRSAADQLTVIGVYNIQGCGFQSSAPARREFKQAFGSRTRRSRFRPRALGGSGHLRRMPVAALKRISEPARPLERRHFWPDAASFDHRGTLIIDGGNFGRE
jgi:hypothetical protein